MTVRLTSRCVKQMANECATANDDGIIKLRSNSTGVVGVFWIVVLSIFAFMAFPYGIVQTIAFSSVSCRDSLATSYAAIRVFFVLIQLSFVMVTIAGQVGFCRTATINSFMLCHVMCTNIVMSVRSVTEYTRFFYYVHKGYTNESCDVYWSAGNSSACNCSVDDPAYNRAMQVYLEGFGQYAGLSSKGLTLYTFFVLYFVTSVTIMAEWWMVVNVGKGKDEQESSRLRQILLLFLAYIKLGEIRRIGLLGLIFTIIFLSLFAVGIVFQFRHWQDLQDTTMIPTETFYVSSIITELLLVVLILNACRRVREHTDRTAGNRLLVASLVIFLLAFWCETVFEIIVGGQSLARPESDTLSISTWCLVVTVVIERFFEFVQAGVQTAFVIKSFRKSKI